MKLCLKCWRVWPNASVYCPQDQASMNKRFCPNGHENPMFTRAVTCVICNQGPLTHATIALSLEGLTHFITFVLTLAFLRWLWASFGAVICLTLSGILHIIAFITGTTPQMVAQAMANLFTLIFLLWAMSHFAPGSQGEKIRQGLRWCFGALRSLARIAWKAARRLF